MVEHDRADQRKRGSSGARVAAARAVCTTVVADDGRVRHLHRGRARCRGPRATTEARRDGPADGIHRARDPQSAGGDQQRRPAAERGRARSGAQAPCGDRAREHAAAEPSGRGCVARRASRAAAGRRDRLVGLRPRVPVRVRARSRPGASRRSRRSSRPTSASSSNSLTCGRCCTTWSTTRCAMRAADPVAVSCDRGTGAGGRSPAALGTR